MEYCYFFASYEDFKITTDTESAELNFARHAKSKLAPLGIKCYVDRDDATLGRSHFHNFNRASKNSKYLVLLLTEESLKSFETDAINVSNNMFQASLFRRWKRGDSSVFAIRLGDFHSENDEISIPHLPDIHFTSSWDESTNKASWDRLTQMGTNEETTQPG